MQKSQEIMQSLCEKYELVIKENLLARDSDQVTYSALNNDGIYRVADRSGLMFVLKLGLTRRAIEEISINNIGYQKLRSLGMDWFIPRILVTEIGEQFGMMLMEDCGENFLSQAKKSTLPLKLYAHLLNELERVYIRSRRKNHDGKKMVEAIIDLIVQQYEEYIYMHLDKERTLVSRLVKLKLSIDINILKFCCFSSWDFVPENIFLTPMGLKYIDPHEGVVGIPIIDMACFAGLIRLYNLPEADEGYRMFQEFALTKIPPILHIPEELANKLFLLGRVLQCFLSTRFRLVSDPSQARQMFLEGKECLESIIGI